MAESLQAESFGPIILSCQPRGRRMCAEELRAAAGVVDGNFSPALGFHRQGD